nr:threonine aspartase 1 [Quercus suber]
MLTEIKNPISLARTLLDHTEQPMTLRRVPPNLLIGQGATDYAYEHGIPVLPIEMLISPSAKERWKRWRNELDKADTEQRREQGEEDGMLAETDLADYLHSTHNFEQDRKAHTQAMRAGLFNEGQPMSPPPTSDQRELYDHGSESLNSLSKHSTPELECAPTSLHSYNDNAPLEPPGVEAEACSKVRLPSIPILTEKGVGTALPGGGVALQVSRGCGSTAWRSGHLRQHPASTTCGWQDGSSSSDSGDTAIVMDRTVEPQNVNPTQPLDDRAPTHVHITRMGDDHHNGSTALPSKDGAPIKDHDLITDTVGAIAIDIHGRIACGASSGGIGMKHRGRIGPAAVVGTGAYVIPIAEGDRDGISVATVTSGTGEHMATTVAAKTCSDRVYTGQRVMYGGKLEDCGDDEAVHGFIKQDFMNHPSVKHSHSAGAIGMLTVKKSNQGIYLYYGHNTDSFALASMHSDEAKPVCTMSRGRGKGGVAQGGRAIRYRKKK